MQQCHVFHMLNIDAAYEHVLDADTTLALISSQKKGLIAQDLLRVFASGLIEC